MTERLIVSLFYMRIIVHTSGKKLYEQKIVVIVMVTITEAIKQYKKMWESCYSEYIFGRSLIIWKVSF